MRLACRLGIHPNAYTMSGYFGTIRKCPDCGSEKHV